MTGRRRESPPARPDVELGATVRAKELRFDEVPDTDVSFDGNPDIETGNETERENLPEEVEPGVTYRDVEVRWRAGTRLADEAESEHRRR